MDAGAAYIQHECSPRLRLPRHATILMLFSALCNSLQCEKKNRPTSLPHRASARHHIRRRALRAQPHAIEKPAGLLVLSASMMSHAETGWSPTSTQYFILAAASGCWTRSAHALPMRCTSHTRADGRRAKPSRRRARRHAGARSPLHDMLFHATGTRRFRD